jgi:hypothetical protein
MPPPSRRAVRYRPFTSASYRRRRSSRATWRKLWGYPLVIALLVAPAVIFSRPEEPSPARDANLAPGRTAAERAPSAPAAPAPSAATADTLAAETERAPAPAAQPAPRVRDNPEIRPSPSASRDPDRTPPPSVGSEPKPRPRVARPDSTRREAAPPRLRGPM